MIELEENKRRLTELNSKLLELKDSLKIDELKQEILSIENQTQNPEFWNNVENSNAICGKLKKYKKIVLNYEELKEELQNVFELNEMLDAEQDEVLYKELVDLTDKIQKKIDLLEVDTLFSGKYDRNNAIITFHPGAGGTESQDWVQMLYRMYIKWANSNGLNIKETDFLPGDEAGIKSVTAIVSGENAYGFLKGEMGVHRLVRISPFDSGGRRHTSFASLEVLPEIDNDINIEINPDDLRIDTYRSSGAGGQHINKTDSAVRITHIPTNIVVSCQSERSQMMNKETAMRMLKSKLLDLKEKQNKESIDELKGIQKDIAWGSQIRSYVFCPYTMVKDHRTNYEVGNVEAVMNGEITDFMIEYLKYIKKNERGE